MEKEKGKDDEAIHKLQASGRPILFEGDANQQGDHEKHGSGENGTAEDTEDDLGDHALGKSGGAVENVDEAVAEKVNAEDEAKEGVSPLALRKL